MERKRKYSPVSPHTSRKKRKAFPKKGKDRDPSEDEHRDAIRALNCLLPGKGGPRVDGRRKKRGLALHREILKQLHAEKEAAKAPWRRVGVWRSRPMSTRVGAGGENTALQGKKELVYVAISGEIIGKPICFRVAADEKKFLAARGITDRPDPSSCLLWPERLPPYPDLRFPSLSSSLGISGEGPSTSGDFGTSCALGYWCIPQSVVEAYSRAGIQSLYPWQASCLHLAFPFASSAITQDGGFGRAVDTVGNGQGTAHLRCTPSRRRLPPREGSLTGQSLLYCAPTSGGKSLVADLIMIRRCLFAGKRCLYVVPHVSLCREKQQFLQSLLSPTVGLRVQAFHSSAASASGWFPGIDIAVCTVEQANNILNRLLQEASPLVRAQALHLEDDIREEVVREHGAERLTGNGQERSEARAAAQLLRAGRGNVAGGVGVVVLDEFHFLGEKERGYLLECLLMKLNFLNSFLRQNIQLVAMSATLPNVAELADWLDAEVFTTALRPLPLDYFIKCEGALYRCSTASMPGGPSPTAPAVSLPSLPPRLELRPQLVRRLPRCRRTLPAQFVACAGVASQALEEAAVSFIAEGVSVHALTQTMIAARAEEALQNSRSLEKQAGEETETGAVGEHQRDAMVHRDAPSPGQEEGGAKPIGGDALLGKTRGFAPNNSVQGQKATEEANNPTGKLTGVPARPILKVKEERAEEPKRRDRELQRSAEEGGTRDSSMQRMKAESLLCAPGNDQQLLRSEGSRQVAHGSDRSVTRDSEKLAKYGGEPANRTDCKREKIESRDRGLQVHQGASSRGSTLQNNPQASASPKANPPFRGKALVDDEHLGYLVWETVREEKSVIVFCATKSWCERSASYLESRLPLYRLLDAAAWLSQDIPGDRASGTRPEDFADFLDSSRSVDMARRLLQCPALFVTPSVKHGRQELLWRLRQTGPLCPRQERAILEGIAYHHAGLAGPARAAIEQAYHQGVLRVLCATSTLAVGVNLPAARVILRSPEIGRDAMDVARFRQMAGRAGRTGYETRGEAILFCSLSQLPTCLSLVSGMVAPGVSSANKAVSEAKLQQPACVTPPPTSCLSDHSISPVTVSRETGLSCSAASKWPSLSASVFSSAVPPLLSVTQPSSFLGSPPAADETRGGMEAVRSQLKGLRLVRALLEACEFLLPLTQFLSPQVLSAGCQVLQQPDLLSARRLKSDQATQKERPCSVRRPDLGKLQEPDDACLFASRDQCMQSDDGDPSMAVSEGTPHFGDSSERKEREKGDSRLPTVARLFGLIRLCTLRGRQLPGPQMLRELAEALAYLHENFLVEIQEPCKNLRGEGSAQKTSVLSPTTDAVECDYPRNPTHSANGLGRQERKQGERAAVRVDDHATRMGGQTVCDYSRMEALALLQQPADESLSLSNQPTWKCRRLWQLPCVDMRRREYEHLEAVQKVKALQKALQDLGGQYAKVVHGSAQRGMQSFPKTNRSFSDTNKQIEGANRFSPLERMDGCVQGTAGHSMVNQQSQAQSPRACLYSRPAEGQVKNDQAEPEASRKGSGRESVALSLESTLDSSKGVRRAFAYHDRTGELHAALQKAQQNARAADHAMKLLTAQQKACDLALMQAPQLRAPVTLMRFFIREVCPRHLFSNYGTEPSRDWISGQPRRPYSGSRTLAFPAGGEDLQLAARRRTASDRPGDISQPKETAPSSCLSARRAALQSLSASCDSNRHDTPAEQSAVGGPALAIDLRPVDTRSPPHSENATTDSAVLAIFQHASTFAPDRPDSGGVRSVAPSSYARKLFTPRPSVGVLPRNRPPFGGAAKFVASALSAGQSGQPGEVSFFRVYQHLLKRLQSAWNRRAGERVTLGKSAWHSEGSAEGQGQNTVDSFSASCGGEDTSTTEAVICAYDAASGKVIYEDAIRRSESEQYARGEGLRFHGNQTVAKSDDDSHRARDGHSVLKAAELTETGFNRMEWSSRSLEGHTITGAVLSTTPLEGGEQKHLGQTHTGNSALVSCTYVGVGAAETGLTPWEAVEIFADLFKMMHQGLSLRSDVHLLYLGASPVVPQINVCWNTYLRVFDDLDVRTRQLAGLIGVSREFIIASTRSSSTSAGATDAAEAFHEMHESIFRDRLLFEELWKGQELLVHRRFFAALQLSDILTKDAPLWKVAEKFGSSPSAIQGLLSQAVLFAATVAKFVSNMPPQLSALGDVFRALGEKLRLHAHSPCTAMWSPPPGSRSSYSSAGFKSGQRLSSPTLQPSLGHREGSPSREAVGAMQQVAPGVALPQAVRGLLASFEGLSLRQAAALVAAGLDCADALARASIGVIHKALEATEPADVCISTQQGDPVRVNAFRVVERRKRETRRFVTSVMIKTEAQRLLRNAQQELDDAATQRELAAWDGLSQCQKEKATRAQKERQCDAPDKPARLAAYHRSPAEDPEGVLDGTDTSREKSRVRNPGQRVQAGPDTHAGGASRSRGGRLYSECKREITDSRSNIGVAHFLQRAHLCSFLRYSRRTETDQKRTTHSDTRIPSVYQDERQEESATDCSPSGTESDDPSSLDTESMYSLSLDTDSDPSWASGVSTSDEGGENE
ncbi:dead deah box helicase domain-containing protein [Cystoisospora suis]|uniref:Dead deah box helicase domain-containing protein n=1 Tax=Cystoisospora suis TaxID=483139 RepID=A0A2C6LAT1_9APIC|nr:dead deah box helicase domain-containing protein [Cystoisospora suis]